MLLGRVMVMSDIEREEFEQAVKNQWSDSYSFTRFGDEDYYDEVLEGMWQGWQASRQALEGEPVAWWDGDTSAAEDSFSFKSDRYYTIPLYTHPASAEVERLQSRVAAQQSALNSICTCSWGAAEFFDVGKAASWMQKIAYDALDEVPSTEAFILRKQAEAVQASRQAVSVPEGWKLVPINPTIAMVKAAFDALEVVKPMQYANGTAARNAVYASMIAAAPQPPQQEQDQ